MATVQDKFEKICDNIVYARASDGFGPQECIREMRREMHRIESARNVTLQLPKWAQTLEGKS